MHTIPPISHHDRRTLVLCFDGTGDMFSADNSNIILLTSLLSKDIPSRQQIYYQAGIGTYTIPEIATPFMAGLSKALDMMLGVHLDAHVMGGYEFLMQNYQAGDKICIFGFSRGAYTARALAGMLHKVGLLPASNHQQVPFAYHMYTQDDPTGWSQSNAFKRAFARDVGVEFVGVWDTVSSVGFFPRRLPFTRSNSHIKYFRHAMSLDERRCRFHVNSWYSRFSVSSDEPMGVQPGEMERSGARCGCWAKDGPGKGGVNGMVNGNASDEDKGSYSDSEDGPGEDASTEREEASKQPNSREKPNQNAIKPNHNGISKDKGKDAARCSECDYETDVKEVWFAGCHCDIGGGSVPNMTPHSLARIPLRWMLRELFALNIGIIFDRRAMVESGLWGGGFEGVERGLGIGASAGGKVSRVVDSASEHEDEDDDRVDALSPAYDQLELAPGWWALEVTPQPMPNIHRDRGEGGWGWGINFGRPRVLPLSHQLEHGVKIHKSVKTRMEHYRKNKDTEDKNDRGKEEAKEGRYTPRMEFDVEIEWVE